MSEQSDHLWYLAFDLVLFLLAVTALFLLLNPLWKRLELAAGTGNPVSEEMEQDDPISVYMGQKQYGSGSSLYGDTWEEADLGEYTSREGVFEELMRMPENVTQITIDGMLYANRQDSGESYHGMDNLSYYVEEGDTETIGSWVAGSGTLFLKTYDYDSRGRVCAVTYTSM